MTAAWILFIAFCLAFLAFIAMASAAIRLASRLNDAERNLRSSKQAHALDVAALSKKLYEQSRVLAERRSVDD